MIEAEMVEEAAPSSSPSTKRGLIAYLRRLQDTFGLRYCGALSLVYGVNQGVGEALLFGAQRYYFLDVVGSSAARYTQIDGFTNIPWQIKAIYGMVSDTFPIRGMRRSPYMGLAGVCGIASALGLWVLPPREASGALLLVLSNFSIASPDVMVDATTAEKAKSHPALAADVQSLCWGSLYSCSFLAYFCVGWLLEKVGPRNVFGLFSLTSLAALVPASFGWLGENTKPAYERVVVQNPLRTEEEQLDAIIFEATAEPDDKPTKRAVFGAAVLTCGTSVVMGSLQAFYSGPRELAIEGTTTIALGVVLATCLYFLLGRVSKDLAGGAIYIFIAGALQPSTSVVFDWSHDDGQSRGNCARACDEDDDSCGWARDRNYPCISPHYYSIMKACSALFGLVGVVLYNSFFSEWTYRTVFFVSQLAYFGANLLDVVWVSRINLSLGVPDYLFLFGVEVVQPIIQKLHVMPIFVMAARLCPPNVEATLFALLMGLSNFGAVVGLYNGVVLLHLFGGVDQPDFRYLPHFVFVRTLCYLSPVLLIPVFVPKGSPLGGDQHAMQDLRDKAAQLQFIEVILEKLWDGERILEGLSLL
ncbi:hypothetical protein CTAYLR_005189 [Chrysophaeum taylorii]|uniref:Uncharacterized protein n=1 Tax=Chrysophaeum taylorii TaxID=2483200 RepID=A0AAD7XR34_9STRA|nr:hypothetical protein CTAYLR_005172 [Chrysophaeum taylorii]KAJ8614169.1 hypothetical protein CTAYLR_005189 [Chrysophaeum taylorii]